MHVETRGYMGDIHMPADSNYSVALKEKVDQTLKQLLKKHEFFSAHSNLLMFSVFKSTAQVTKEITEESCQPNPFL